MITLTTSGNTIYFQFEDNPHYLQNGVIAAPKNSLILVTDDSQMATFKKIDGDVFVSALYSELGMSKSELEEWFEENATTNYGGGGGGGDITSGEVQTMIDDALTDYYDIDEVDAAISGKADTDDLTAVNNVLTAHTGNTTIHVTAGDKLYWDGKSDFSGSYNDLTDKPTIPTVPTSNTAFTNDAGYVTSGYVDSAVSGKQDTLSAGTGISISGNVISATGGGGGANAIEVTQAVYDALVSAGTVDLTAFYIITDAPAVDLSGYAQTSAVTAEITAAVSGKVDTSTYNTYTAATNTALNGKQSTLVSGTNIKTINNESLLGSGNIVIQGGGAASSAITSGDTNAVAGGAVYDQLDGLKLKKVTQAGYDALVSGGTVDSNTLYIIVPTPAPTCLAPSSATTYNVNGDFDFTKPVYELDFQLLSNLTEHQIPYDQASTVIIDSANTAYDVICTYDSQNDSWDLIILNNTGGTIYTSSTSSFNCCDVFGQPMYIGDESVPVVQTCDGYECTEYECIEEDPETGECIEYGDTCIQEECTQGYTDNYVLEVLA